MQAGHRRVNVVNDLEVEVPEQSETALVSSLRSKDKVFIILMCRVSDELLRMALIRSTHLVHPAN